MEEQEEEEEEEPIIGPTQQKNLGPCGSIDRGTTPRTSLRTSLIGGNIS